MTLNALLTSDFVTPATRSVLEARLQAGAIAVPLFFNEGGFSTVGAICARLVPQPDGPAVDLPGLLDAKLHSGKGKGWRYEELPPEGEAFRLGIEGIQDEALVRYGAAFESLGEGEQVEVLQAMQSGETRSAVWEQLPAGRFFEELLVALVELYYSHPLAKATIADASFADAKGWQHIGLNEVDGHELPLVSTPLLPI